MRSQVACSLSLILLSFVPAFAAESQSAFEKRVKWLERYRRPPLSTEYMARGNGGTFQGIMPIAKARNVAVYHWGLVAGKAQTNLPWDSWRKPYVGREPAVWFHEVFQTGGKPYRLEEASRSFL